MNNVVYKQVEVRQYLRRNRLTGETEEVSVSNRNDLSVEEHLRLLNLNDKEFEYISRKGDRWKN